MWLIEIVVHGVGLSRILSRKVFIDRQPLGDTLNETRNHLAVLVYPRVVIAPMVLEVALNDLHLFASSILSILLHPTVDGGVDFQATGIEVISLVEEAVLLEVVRNILTEVERLTIIVLLNLVIELHRQLAEGVAVVLREVVIGHHITKHRIATGRTVLRIRTGIIHGGRLEHADKRGSLLDGELLGSGVKVGFGSCLHTKRIGTEVHRVGVHRDNLLLAVHGLQLRGNDPLLALHNQYLQSGNLAQ